MIYKTHKKTLLGLIGYIIRPNTWPSPDREFQGKSLDRAGGENVKNLMKTIFRKSKAGKSAKKRFRYESFGSLPVS